MVQIKEQGRNSQDQINEEEISKLPEKEFRVMISKDDPKSQNRMEKMQESINTFNKDLEESTREGKVLQKQTPKSFPLRSRTRHGAPSHHYYST